MAQADTQLGSVVCKFKVGKVADNHDRDGKVYQQDIELYAVYGSDPQSENARFWTATPAGRMQLTINNPGCWGFFQPDQEFYITLRHAGNG